MILSFCGISLAASLFFSGLPSDKTTTASEKAGYYATDWEEVPVWNRTEAGKDVVYGYNRSTAEWDPKVAGSGTVVAFVKGYDISGFSKTEKPVALPFYFMAPDENSGTWNWDMDCTNGNVHIALEMPQGMESAFLKSNSSIRLRYFLISKELMTKHKLTPQSIRGMSYSKLSSILGLSPQA